MINIFMATLAHAVGAVPGKVVPILCRFLRAGNGTAESIPPPAGGIVLSVEHFGMSEKNVAIDAASAASNGK